MWLVKRLILRRIEQNPWCATAGKSDESQGNGGFGKRLREDATPPDAAQLLRFFRSIQSKQFLMVHPSLDGTTELSCLALLRYPASRARTGNPRSVLHRLLRSSARLQLRDVLSLPEGRLITQHRSECKTQANFAERLAFQNCGE